MRVIYTIFTMKLSISTQTTLAYWLIRAIKNRWLIDEDNELKDLKLIETVKNKKPVGMIEFEFQGVIKQSIVR